MTDRRRLLLAEDDPRLGPIIRDVLAEEWEVELVEDGAVALQLASTEYFSVLIIDRRLPGLDGVEVVRELRRQRHAVPILLLTALGQIADRVEGLEAGANDYLIKPFAFDELVARLHALTRDYTSPEEGLAVGAWTFYPDQKTIESPDGRRIQLTPKESDLLAIFARNPDTAFTRRQLLSAVFDADASDGMIDTYVHYLRDKISRDVVTTVFRVGYRLGQPG